ncbi:M42 family peptidase [Paenibacillus psychroresistens]|uniref:M42 family peptidase n=1 Tax=Paenibacillus psychroresistens TaxID=1778678 RepID=A0A6B8RY43_9BACL|nr:M42 family metallopeptidase [Paenibacillus psychroresistens]QGR00027.1 M42 family peptidase [Paenibacillus psychroresistens]
MDYVVNILEKLIGIPSPSGYTDSIVEFLQQELNTFNMASQRIQKGGLLVTVAGSDSSKHRLVSAHVDTLGAMVKEITDKGKLKLSLVGGFTYNSIEGEYCQIHTLDGRIYTGTIHLSKTSVHIHRDTNLIERSQENMEVRLDEQVKSLDEVKELGIQIGDFISFSPRFVKLDNGFIKSRHIDAKAPVACLLAILKDFSENKVVIPYTTHFFFSNNEEIGFGANSNIPEETVEYVAVDIGICGIGQASNEFSVSICAKDSGGPYHYELRKQLVQLAIEQNIGYTIDIFPNYGSDATSAMHAGYDVKHGLIGPGVDSSHAMERTHQDSLENTSKLVRAYLLSSMMS